MTSWRWVTFEDGAKMLESHMIHAWTKHAVLSDLKARYPDCCIIKEQRPSDKMFLDCPGMVAVDRPQETFRLLGLDLTIPCEEVALFSERILAALTDPDAYKHWRGTGHQWMKLRGFHRILVLTRHQAEALWRMMDDRKVETEKRADAFQKAFLKRLQSGRVEAVN